MSNLSEVDLLTNILFNEFKAIAIKPEQTAEIIGRSKVSLARDRAEGIGIAYTKLGKGHGSDRVMYNIYDISKYIVDKKIIVKDYI